MLPRRWWSWQAAVAAAVMVLALPARAAIFEDDDARKAILELRQRLIQLEQTNAQQAADAAKTQAQLREQIQAMQRSALELNAQLEALRGEIARLRGNDEQMARDLADVQRRQKDICRASTTASASSSR